MDNKPQPLSRQIKWEIDQAEYPLTDAKRAFDEIEAALKAAYTTPYTKTALSAAARAAELAESAQAQGNAALDQAAAALGSAGNLGEQSPGRCASFITKEIREARRLHEKHAKADGADDQRITEELQVVGSICEARENQSREADTIGRYLGDSGFGEIPDFVRRLQVSRDYRAEHVANKAAEGARVLVNDQLGRERNRREIPLASSREGDIRARLS